MAYLALFRIKNGTFPYTNYGLNDTLFSIDVSTSVNANKGVSFTQYPLLDGTTRIDSVSKAPGTLNFNGKIGEVFHSPNTDYNLKESQLETRSKRFIKLLEDLRDQAIVLDIITENKTFENYLIESVNFGMTQLGVTDVSFTMKEFISFGSDLLVDETFSPADFTESYLNENALINLKLNNFTTEEEMREEIFKLLTNDSIARPYMIKFGSGDFGFNPDVAIPGISCLKPTLTIKRETTSGGSYVERTYTCPKVRSSLQSAIYKSGNTVGNLNIQLSIPRIEAGSLVKEETINKDSLHENQVGLINMTNGDYDYRPDKFKETNKYNVEIKLFEGDNLLKTFINDTTFTSPKFSDVGAGVNPTKPLLNSLENDLMLGLSNSVINKQALNFIRRTSDSRVYKMIGNLLSDISYGYLYPVRYFKTLQYGTFCFIGFIYFHPALVEKLTELLNEALITPTNLLNNKKLIWW